MTSTAPTVGSDEASSRAGRVEGRFELVTLLKRGNGINTYAGIDHQHGSDVIVKAVETASMPTAVYSRLEHTARLLERLDLGTSRRVVWCGQRERFFYVVQPRLDGEPLDVVLARGPLTVGEVLQLAAAVLATLEQVHALGVLHRDIKPPNIIVGRDGGVLTAELVDFGLSRGGDLDGPSPGGPTGTVRYIALEAAGLITAVVDQRADLYSLGVVLFECLAGHPPFTGDTVGDVLRQHLNVTAPQLRSMGIAVPRSLEGVLQRLLAKDPGGRYQSAGSVLEDVNEIAAAVAAGAEPSVTAGASDRRHMLAEPAFVGRDEELGELIGVLDEAPGPLRRLILVEAESGAGKTRLLDELSLHATEHNTLVLRGQGVDQAAPLPFQMLSGIAEGIVAMDLDLVVPRGLRAQLGDWAGATAAILPALTGVLGPVDTAGLGPEEYGEARSIDALLALLEALGQAPEPVLILLDDCQWADAMTLRLLDRWLAREAPAAGCSVVIVASYRSEEVPEGHPLRSVDPTAKVSLRPFGGADVEALCESMAGPLPPEAIDAVVRLADGSPFMASAVLRGMVETGALRDGPEGWHIDPGPMEDVQTSRRAALILLPPLRPLRTRGAELLDDRRHPGQGVRSGPRGRAGRSAGQRRRPGPRRRPAAAHPLGARGRGSLLVHPRQAAREPPGAAAPDGAAAAPPGGSREDRSGRPRTFLRARLSLRRGRRTGPCAPLRAECGRRGPRPIRPRRRRRPTTGSPSAPPGTTWRSRPGWPRRWETC